MTGGAADYHTSLFDPSTMAWVRGPYMNIPRGYQVNDMPCAKPSDAMNAWVPGISDNLCSIKRAQLQRDVKGAAVQSRVKTTALRTLCWHKC